MRSVFGIEFSPLVEQELADIIVNHAVPTQTGPRAIFTANVDHVARLQVDAEFRSAYESAWQVTADGMPVYLYARARRVPLKKRVTGADLFPVIMNKLQPGTHRAFFVCSSEMTAFQLARWLSQRGFAAGEMAFTVPPFGFERDDTYSAELADKIAQHGTTHLFFGVGAPKSEKWIHRHRAKLGDCYALPIGAALEFFVGEKRRAPAWMQQSGLEWLWRLGQEPGRLAQRYLVGSWNFFAAIRNDLRPADGTAGQ